MIVTFKPKFLFSDNEFKFIGWVVDTIKFHTL